MNEWRGTRVKVLLLRSVSEPQKQSFSTCSSSSFIAGFQFSPKSSLNYRAALPLPLGLVALKQNPCSSAVRDFIRCLSASISMTENDGIIMLWEAFSHVWIKRLKYTTMSGGTLDEGKSRDISDD